MKKIPSLFVRDHQDMRRLTRTVTPGCEWVIAGEGRATVKWDGAACMIRGGVLYKRYDAKGGKKPPPMFEPAQEPDPITGHWPGWIPVGKEPESKWFREAFYDSSSVPWIDATYECIGPKIGGNPHNAPGHTLVPHGAHWFDPEPPTDYDGLEKFLSERHIEGIVWHHPDGRMAKIKSSDFGIPWPSHSQPKEAANAVSAD